MLYISKYEATLKILLLYLDPELQWLLKVKEDLS